MYTLLNLLKLSRAQPVDYVSGAAAWNDTMKTSIINIYTCTSLAR